MLTLSLEIAEEARVPAAPDAVYALLSDIPASAAHFPQVEAVEPDPSGVWTWRLERIGLGKVSIQTVYGLRYTLDPAAPGLAWEPAPGVGNATASGAWTIEPAAGGSRILFRNRLEVGFRGVPGVLRRVIEPLATQENARLVRAYLANLGRTLGGGNGRLR